MPDTDTHAPPLIEIPAGFRVEGLVHAMQVYLWWKLLDERLGQLAMRDCEQYGYPLWDLTHEEREAEIRRRHGEDAKPRRVLKGWR